MNTVKCPDCGSQISRRSTHCPHCGCPTSVAISDDNSFLESGCGIIIVTLAIIGYCVRNSDSDSEHSKEVGIQNNIQEVRKNNKSIKNETQTQVIDENSIIDENLSVEDIEVIENQTTTNSQLNSNIQKFRDNSIEVSLSGLSDSIQLLNLQE